MKFSSEEYMSLRDEAIKRVELYNTGNISTITIFFAALAGLATLMKVNDLSFATIILALFFTLLPLLIISPLAQKSHDNLRQLINLSAYLRVMYEYPSQRESGNDVRAWEWFNGLGYSGVPFLRTINAEYSILAVWDTILNVLTGLFVNSTVFRENSGFSDFEQIWTKIALIIYGAVTLIMLLSIVLQYNPMKIFKKYSIQYQIHYLVVAKRLGHMDDTVCCEYFTTMIQDELDVKDKKNKKLKKYVNKAFSDERDKDLIDKFQKIFSSIVRQKQAL